MPTENPLAGAACRGLDPELFFDGRRESQAKRICQPCPVRDTCLQRAVTIEVYEHIAHRDDGTARTALGLHGVYGGYSPREREPLVRRRVNAMIGAGR